MRFNTLSDWLAWQEQLHPETIELGLDRISQVWSRLHAGPFDCPVISIAGTNGKGSSVAMLQSIYSAAGYRVGAYTSPHLWYYNERINVCGTNVDDQSLCASFERIDQARDDISLTYFEFGTLAALDIFKRSALDVVILEVGLGGRLDAVNIIDADVALITSIDLDHQHWLGHDRDSIAREKAGIMRKTATAIIGGRDTPALLSELAHSMGAHTFVLGQDFDFTEEQGHWIWERGKQNRYSLPRPGLIGDHQLQNAAAVVMVVEALKPGLPVSQAHLRDGLLASTIAGRCSYYPSDISTFFDVAHNPAAARQLSQALARVKQARVHAVFSCLADKDIPGLLRPLCGQVSGWYFAGMDVARAAKLTDMKTALALACPDAPMQTFCSVEQAYKKACEDSIPGDIVLVYGSFYTVAAAIEEGRLDEE